MSILSFKQCLPLYSCNIIWFPSCFVKLIKSMLQRCDVFLSLKGPESWKSFVTSSTCKKNSFWQIWGISIVSNAMWPCLIRNRCGIYIKEVSSTYSPPTRTEHLFGPLLAYSIIVKHIVVSRGFGPSNNELTENWVF